jgi:hypothetical protein
MGHGLEPIVCAEPAIDLMAMIAKRRGEILSLRAIETGCALREQRQDAPLRMERGSTGERSGASSWIATTWRTTFNISRTTFNISLNRSSLRRRWLMLRAQRMKSGVPVRCPHHLPNGIS